MERKTRSGKVIVEVKPPAKQKGRKKKSEYSENPPELVQQVQIQQPTTSTVPLRRSFRGKAQNDSLDVPNIEDTSNMSIISLDESTKTSSSDVQNPEGEKVDNFFLLKDLKAEIAMKTLEIKLIDCCLHEKSSSEDIKTESEDVEMTIEEPQSVVDEKSISGSNLLVKPVNLESTVEEVSKNVVTAPIDKNIMEVKEEPKELIIQTRSTRSKKTSPSHQPLGVIAKEISQPSSSKNKVSSKMDNVSTDKKDDIEPTIKVDVLPTIKDNVVPSVKDDIVPTKKDTVLPIKKDNVVLTKKDIFMSTKKSSILSAKKDDIHKQLASTKIDDVVPTKVDDVVIDKKDTVVPIKKDIIASTKKDIVAPTERDDIVTLRKPYEIKEAVVVVVKEELMDYQEPNKQETKEIFKEMPQEISKMDVDEPVVETVDNAQKLDEIKIDSATIKEEPVEQVFVDPVQSSSKKKEDLIHCKKESNNKKDSSFSRSKKKEDPTASHKEPILNNKKESPACSSKKDDPMPSINKDDSMFDSSNIEETLSTIKNEDPAQISNNKKEAVVPEKDPDLVLAELLETSFLRRSRRLKSIYLEGPIKSEDSSTSKDTSTQNSPDISKNASKTKSSTTIASKKQIEQENDVEMTPVPAKKSTQDQPEIKQEEISIKMEEDPPRPQPNIISESCFVSQCDARLSQFITIKDNIYMKSSDKVICKVNKTMKCDCTMTEEDLKNGEMGCRYNCINRLLFIECSSKCRCGEFCDNQQFQRYNYSPISVFRTEKKGFGLIADDDIPPETFIIEYVGEVLNNKQFEKRAKKYSKDKNRHYYFMALRSNAVIDATIKGNISRFINHSCDPNAMTQKWTVNGELRVGFFSIRKISRGEEITFDYQFQRYGKEAQKCFCESENCRGWIGENPESDAEEVEVEDAKAKKGKPVKKPAPPPKKPVKVKTDKSETEEEELIKKEEVEEKEGEEEEEETEVPEDVEIKKEPEKIVRKPRKQALLEDLEIEEEINDLNKSGLKNRLHTIRLARLVVRAKNTDARSRLLKILIAGDFPCRRLFLDYNGLRLLHSWMCDISIKSSVPDICLCIDLMNALDVLPITNKTVLRDSKILERVEKWKNLDLEKKKLSKEEKKQAKADKKKNKAANKLQLDNSSEQFKTDELVFVRTFDVLEELPTMKLILKETASELLNKWEVLKEDFRIPKKQKQEIMIEHEREAGGMDDWQVNNVDSFDNNRFKNRFGEDSFAANSSRTFNSSYKKAIDPVERQHRRQMYAMKVAQQEMEKTMEGLYDNNCALFGLPAGTHPLMIPVRVNRVTGEYCNIYGSTVPIPPNHQNFKYEPLTLSTNPDDYDLPPLDLPEHWKYAIDKFGRIYYYHEKIRQPQWEVPIKLLPMVNSDNEENEELDSDESFTETEDEEEEELKELLEMLKKKKQLIQSQTAANPQSSDLNEEDELEKKIMNNMISNPPENYQAIKLSQLPVKKFSKKKSRRGLSTMKFIRPRTEEDKIYGRTETKRYKEVKEKLRRDKKRRMLLGEQHISDEDDGDTSLNESSLAKMVDELDILNKSKELDKIRRLKKDTDLMINKKKESPIDPAKMKKSIKPVPPPISSAENSNIRKQFRDEIKEEIMKFLLPYRDESCINGKIVSEEDYISLVNKLTFSVLTKESKHCAQSNSILKATESVKGKTKEYIKKYMAKFEGPYQRKSDEQDYASILCKM